MPRSKDKLDFVYQILAFKGDALDESQQDIIIDIITDLLHFCDDRLISAESVFRMARERYLAERAPAQWFCLPDRGLQLPSTTLRAATARDAALDYARRMELADVKVRPIASDGSFISHEGYETFHFSPFELEVH